MATTKNLKMPMAPKKTTKNNDVSITPKDKTLGTPKGMSKGMPMGSPKGTKGQQKTC